MDSNGVVDDDVNFSNVGNKIYVNEAPQKSSSDILKVSLQTEHKIESVSTFATLKTAFTLDQERVLKIEEMAKTIKRLVTLEADRVNQIVALEETVARQSALDNERVLKIEEMAMNIQRLITLEADRVNQIVALEETVAQHSALDNERIAKISELQTWAENFLPVLSTEASGRPPVVIVNSLLKTASTTIWNSLGQLQHKLIVHHLHAICDSDIKLSLDCAANLPTPYLQWDELSKARKAIVARHDIANELTRSDGRKPFFICGVREPVSMFLSHIFQNDVSQNDEHNNWNYLGSLEQFVIRLENWYFKAPSDPQATGLNPHDWIEREIHGFLGVDPIATGFDIAKGYQIYESKMGKLLLY